MRYLLTGGAGYIGSHTTVELLNRGHEVIIADNFDNSKPEVINRVERITGKRPKVYEVDVCDKDALRVVFEENKIDAVVHFAGLKAVGESVRIPLRYYRNNLESTFSLVEVMKEFGVTKLVFSSSATVYGIPETVPLVETMRKDIESYAQLNNIDYVTDSTNLEDVYSRNIVRNKILSQMCSINQNAIENIIRCSDIITCENDFINHTKKDEPTQLMGFE